MNGFYSLIFFHVALLDVIFDRGFDRELPPIFGLGVMLENLGFQTAIGTSV